MKLKPRAIVFAAFFIILGKIHAQGEVGLFYSIKHTYDSVVNNKVELNVITSKLIVAVKDSSISWDRRAESAFLLGYIGTDSAFAFLFDNISMFFPIESLISDYDQIKDLACFYAIATFLQNKWHMFDLAFNLLWRKESTPEDIRLITVLLKEKTGEVLLKAIVGRELERAIAYDNEIYINNLNQIKAILK